jgi:CelD/BcsL family acetyltransferase involved in cellulose biosynthesis
MQNSLSDLFRVFEEETSAASSSQSAQGLLSQSGFYSDDQHASELKKNNPGWNFSLFQSMDDAEPYWKDLEKRASFSAYQYFQYQRCWWDHIGYKRGQKPLIIAGFKNNIVQLIVPLALSHHTLLQIATWPCGKHSNYNMPLYGKMCVDDFTPDFMQQLLAWVAGEAHIHAYDLANQPAHWEGINNPLAMLNAINSPSFSYKLELADDFEALQRDKRSSSARRKIRAKIRKLEEEAPLQFHTAQTEEKLNRVLNCFFELKAKRFKELGLPDVFEKEKGAKDFLKSISHFSLQTGQPAFQWYYLTHGEDIIATYTGGIANKRFSCSLNSIIVDERMRYSPTDILLTHLIEYACQQGLTTFDIGIGKADYKLSWCEEDPLKDSFIPTSSRGLAYSFAQKIVRETKGFIKNTPLLWSIVTTMRKIKNG